MKKIFFCILLLSTILLSKENTNFAQINKKIKSISLALGSPLYNLDINSLSTIIIPLIEDESYIQGIEVKEYFKPEPVYKAYKDNSFIVTVKHLPNKITKYEHFTQDIYFQNEKVGTLTLYIKRKEFNDYLSTTEQLKDELSQEIENRYDEMVFYLKSLDSSKVEHKKINHMEITFFPKNDSIKLPSKVSNEQQLMKTTKYLDGKLYLEVIMPIFDSNMKLDGFYQALSDFSSIDLNLISKNIDSVFFTKKRDLI